METEVNELRGTVDELKAALEAETLSKVNYQNNVQSLNEELAFRKKVYDEVSSLFFVVFSDTKCS